jgi:hypothetical protein
VDGLVFTWGCLTHHPSPLRSSRGCFCEGGVVDVTVGGVSLSAAVYQPTSRFLVMRSPGPLSAPPRASSTGCSPLCLDGFRHSIGAICAVGRGNRFVRRSEAGRARCKKTTRSWFESLGIAQVACLVRSGR